MAEYIIMTDSCADMPAEYYQEHQVELMRLSYIEGADSYPDNGLAAETDAFYSRMRAGAKATTSQVNMQAFLSRFRELRETGLPILYLCFSSKLSASYNSATAAAEAMRQEAPDYVIQVVDSQAASMGQGLLLHHLVRLRDAGASLTETLAWLEANIYKLNHLFTVADLQYLYRGGRVSAASAFLGNALNIRPLLWVDEQGGLAVWSKERGDKRVMTAMLNLFEKTCDDMSQQIYISHADCAADAEQLKQELQQRFGCENVYINRIGPVIGAHTGPLTYALFYLGTDRREQAQNKK